MTVHRVSDASGLQVALITASGGDTILLEAGDYGSVSISSLNPSSTITIRSSSQGVAHFDGLSIQDSSRLQFTNLDIGRALKSGEPDYTRLNSVTNARDISFTSVVFHGSRDNNPSNDGVGLLSSKVVGLRLEDVTFTELSNGLGLVQSSEIVIEKSRFAVIRSDGIQVAATAGVFIDGNDFSDFRPLPTDHSDAIQFFNAGQSAGSKDITIANNTFIQDVSTDSPVQGIFMSDPLSFGYENVYIDNNLFYLNNAYHGITVAGARNLVISDNTVTSRGDDAKYAWISVLGGNEVSISNNVADVIFTKESINVSEMANIVLQNDEGSRLQLPRLNQASSWSDLHVDGTGYQAPLSTSAGSVSSAMSEGLRSILQNNTGEDVSPLRYMQHELSGTQSQHDLGAYGNESLHGAEEASFFLRHVSTASMLSSYDYYLPLP